MRKAIILLVLILSCIYVPPTNQSRMVIIYPSSTCPDPRLDHYILQQKDTDFYNEKLTLELDKLRNEIRTFYNRKWPNDEYDEKMCFYVKVDEKGNIKYAQVSYSSIGNNELEDSIVSIIKSIKIESIKQKAFQFSIKLSKTIIENSK